jgi:hypothetical protein
VAVSGKDHRNRQGGSTSPLGFITVCIDTPVSKTEEGLDQVSPEGGPRRSPEVNYYGFS